LCIQADGGRFEHLLHWTQNLFPIKN
jgi:hypothetical protein